jgi:hypothetical protein
MMLQNHRELRVEFAAGVSWLIYSRLTMFGGDTVDHSRRSLL